jgi:1,4-alpha-glucan branching enzyme
MTTAHSSLGEKIATMGSFIHENGVFFRVWAPHATEVFVVGDFNNWEPEATPMEDEENGKWAINVPEGNVGQEYKFLLKTPYGEFFRNDPYALQMTNSVGNGVIYDQDAFDWGEDHVQCERRR